MQLVIILKVNVRNKNESSNSSMSSTDNENTKQKIWILFNIKIIFLWIHDICCMNKFDVNTQIEKHC